MLGFFTFSEFDSYMLVDQFGRIITHSDHRHSVKSEKEVYGREFTRLCRFGESMVFVNVLKTTWKFVTFQPRSVLLRPIKRINALLVVFFLNSRKLLRRLFVSSVSMYLLCLSTDRFKSFIKRSFFFATEAR